MGSNVSLMPHFSRSALALAALVAAALFAAIGAGPARAADFDPHAFEVNVEMGPGEDDFVEPDCVPAGEDRMRCTMDMTFSEVGGTHRGTVTHIATGLSGRIEVTCDMEMRQHMVMMMDSSGNQTLEEFSGGGRMACNWFMDYEGDTSLSGVIRGDMDMYVVDYDTGTVAFTGRMSVEVVAGTGEFADVFGGGSWTEHDEFSVFGGGPDGGGPDGGPGGDPEGEGPGEGDYPDGGPPSARGSAAGSLPQAGEDGAMNLRLKKGRARTRIVSPAKVLKRGDRNTRLRVVTARNASCVAGATDGDKRVKLGKARDRDGNSEVRFGPLARQLDPGKWKVNVVCKYPSDGKTVRAAPARQTYNVR